MCTSEFTNSTFCQHWRSACIRMRKSVHVSVVDEVFLTAKEGGK